MLVCNVEMSDALRCWALQCLCAAWEGAIATTNSKVAVLVLALAAPVPISVASVSAAVQGRGVGQAWGRDCLAMSVAESGSCVQRGKEPLQPLTVR